MMAVRKGTSPVSDLLQQLLVVISSNIFVLFYALQEHFLLLLLSLYRVEKTTSFLEESKHKLEKTLGCQEYQVVYMHS